MILDPITNEILKKWEQAGGILAKAAREVRTEVEKGNNVTIKPRGINKALGFSYDAEKQMKPINQRAKKVMDVLTEGIDNIGDHKKIDNTEGTFMPVVIDCIGGCNYGLIYSIAHYHSQAGDLICDPDMVFIKAEMDGNYYPVSFEQGGVIRKEAIIIKDGKVTGIWEHEQCMQKNFANMWMENIRQQQGLVV